MDQEGNQQEQMLTDSLAYEINPLIDNLFLGDEPVTSPLYEIPEWSTSLISEICREGDIERLRWFIDYSQQTLTCGQHASSITDRLDAETGLSPLHHAVRYQQLEICLILLSNIRFVFGVNIKDANGRTSLHTAFRSTNRLTTTNNQSQQRLDLDKDLGNQLFDKSIWKNEYTQNIMHSHHPLINLLVKANGNIDAQDKYLLTPLHYAVAQNNFNGVKQLLCLNANVEAGDRQGVRPLHLACKEGNFKIVECLLQYDALIDATDCDHWTPLHYACARGHFEVIKLFRNQCEQTFFRLIQMKTNIATNCLHLAVQHGDQQIVKFLLSCCSGKNLRQLINEQATTVGTPLHFAAKFSDPSMIELLLSYEADPLCLNDENQSILHIACANNQFSIVEKLIVSKTSSLLEIKDKHGRTPLSVTSNLDIMNLLLNSGVDITSLDHNHMNVLMIAVSKCQISVVDYLLTAAGDQSITLFDQVERKQQRSIFLLAVQTGSIELCSKLMTHPSVRCDSIDKQRMNAFHIAARHNYHLLLHYLCEEMSHFARFMTMTSRNYPVISKSNDNENNVDQCGSLRLLSAINAPNEDGKTPLHFAAERGHTDSIQVLIKFGADPFLPNSLGQLPLHLSIQNGHTTSVELLLNACMKNRTDFQVALSRRQSPLITACQRGYVDIVDLLISRDIGIDHVDPNNSLNHNENPLIVAIHYRQAETVHALIEDPHFEQWLITDRNINELVHQTPLRDMIRFLPSCAKHAFDKFIQRSNENEHDHGTMERMIYNYRFLDDYFLDTKKTRLYANYSHQLYRNHPFIIALDTGHLSLLEHPLARQLIDRKWKLYRSMFYLTRTLTFLLVFILTSYVLLAPPPMKILQEKFKDSQEPNQYLPWLRWSIIILAIINFLKIILETILYHGFRVPFAQAFSMISLLTAIFGFLPIEFDQQWTHWQLECASFSVLTQWFNLAFALRSVPFIGNFIVMFQSIVMNCFSILFIILPLIVGFAISNQMIYSNQLPFQKITTSVHKLSAMLIGEFGYEALFFSQPWMAVSVLIFITFIVIMTVVFTNLLLGLAIGDIQSCMESARTKAKSYRIRELIYIESSLPSLAWLRSNIIDEELIEIHSKTKNSSKTDDEHEFEFSNDQSTNDLLIVRKRKTNLIKLHHVLSMLCTQAKQTLQTESTLEIKLKKLSFVDQKLLATN